MPVRGDGANPEFVSVAALEICSQPSAPVALGWAGGVVAAETPSMLASPLYAAGEAMVLTMGELAGISVSPGIQTPGSNSESETVDASYAAIGFTLPGTSFPTKL